jgi:hypothetical protein
MIFNADSGATRIWYPEMAKFGYDRNHDGAWRLINYAASRASFGKQLAIGTWKVWRAKEEAKIGE